MQGLAWLSMEAGSTPARVAQSLMATPCMAYSPSTVDTAEATRGRMQHSAAPPCAQVHTPIELSLTWGLIY